MLTSVAGAVVPLTQLQSDLYSFLLGIAGMEPAAGLGGLAGAGLSPAADAWVASQWPRGLPFAAIPGGPVAGNAATGVATLDVTALGRASALSRAWHRSMRAHRVPCRRTAAIRVSVGAGPSLRQASPGLAILPQPGCYPFHWRRWPLLALPGVGGLVILTAAGVRVGYRQAKAGFAVRTAGIARFARPGAVPLGVVRSGSLVVVRPRALRVVRPGALSAGCLLDKVA